MVPSCMRGLPLFQRVSFLVQTHNFWRRPTHLKLTAKGENKAYRQTHIGKAIYLYENYNFRLLNGQKHHFTYYFQCKSNVHI